MSAYQFSDFSDSSPILKRLGEHHDGKVGFVIFRTYYGDDQQWAHFVEHLTKSTLEGLSMDGDYVPEKPGEELKKFFAHDIRDDKSKLEDASIDEVRRIFCEWAQSVSGGSKLPKYRLCVLVDKEVIDSVMEGEKPRKNDVFRGYAKLINGEHVNFTPEGYDEEHPPIDGCTAEDVGWMKQSLFDLFPSAYRVLMDFSWGMEYRRPPMIHED